MAEEKQVMDTMQEDWKAVKEPLSVIKAKLKRILESEKDPKLAVLLSQSINRIEQFETELLLVTMMAGLSQQSNKKDEPPTL